MDLTGKLALSLRGRDSGRLFIIVGTENDEYVLLCDGMLRKLEKPKRKKLKHLRIIDGIEPIPTDALTNKSAARLVKDAAASLR